MPYLEDLRLVVAVLSLALGFGLVPAVARWAGRQLRIGLVTAAALDQAVERLGARLGEVERGQADLASRITASESTNALLHTRTDADMRHLESVVSALPRAEHLSQIALSVERLRTDQAEALTPLTATLAALTARLDAEATERGRLLRQVELHGRILSEAASHGN